MKISSKVKDGSLVARKMVAGREYAVAAKHMGEVIGVVQGGHHEVWMDEEGKLHEVRLPRRIVRRGTVQVRYAGR